MGGGLRLFVLILGGLVLVASAPAMASGPGKVPLASPPATSVDPVRLGPRSVLSAYVSAPRAHGPPSAPVSHGGSAAARAAFLPPQSIGPAPASVVTTSFGGLDTGCGYCANTPPDVQIAAGPTYLVEMVNLGGAIFTRGGTTVVVFSLYRYPFGFKSTDFLSDPQILYDNSSQRFFATLTDGTTGNWQLAVSMSSDPLAGWWDYNITGTPAGDLADQPMLGVSDGVVAVGANIFSSTGGTFFGGEFWVVEKSALLTGSVAYFQWWGPSCGSLCSYEPSITPVRSLSSTSVQYFVSSGTAPTTTLTVYAVTGIPPGSTSVSTSTFSVLPMNLPPAAPQRGSAHTLDTSDGRVLDAVWQTGSLWASFVDACVPVGDTQVRSCMRLVEYSTTAATLSADIEEGTAGLYYLYPAMSLDARGDLSVVVGYASSSAYPGLYVFGQPYSTPGVLQPATDLTGSLPSAPVSDPTCTSMCRYGDYFGAATDPAGPTVWVAGEYGSTSAVWSTYIGAVQTIPTFGVGVASAPGSVDLGQSTTFTATASLGTPPYSYSWSGLPPGCTAADASSITCTPTVAGLFPVVVTITDSTGASATSGSYPFRVFPDPVAAAPILSRSTADVGQSVTMSVIVAGGTGVFTYTWVLPPLCSGTSALVTCAPPSPGYYNVSVVAVDSNGIATASPGTPLRVSTAPGATLTASPSPALQGASLTFAAAVVGGFPSYTYNWTHLPAGCIGPTDRGSFSCAPTTAATYAVGVTVTDANGISASAAVNVTVQPSVLGLPVIQGYSVLAGIAVVAVVLVALLLARRRKKQPPSAMPPPPPGQAAPTAPPVPVAPPSPPATPESPPPSPPGPPPPPAS